MSALFTYRVNLTRISLTVNLKTQSKIFYIYFENTQFKSVAVSSIPTAINHFAKNCNLGSFPFRARQNLPLSFLEEPQNSRCRCNLAITWCGTKKTLMMTMMMMQFLLLFNRPHHRRKLAEAAVAVLPSSGPPRLGLAAVYPPVPPAIADPLIDCFPP